MKRFQTSLAASLVGIGVVAVGLAGLVSSTKLVNYHYDAIVILTTAMLLVSIVGTLFRHGENRAYWTGFALFGWAFFLLFFTARQLNIPFYFNTIEKILSTIRPKPQGEHVSIAKCIMILLLAGFGGCIARYFYTMRNRDQTIDQKTTPSN
jgi:hypothetical protein